MHDLQGEYHADIFFTKSIKLDIKLIQKILIKFGLYLYYI